MLWIVIISGILGGIAEVLYKKITVKEYASISYLFIYAVLGVLFSLPVFLFNFHIPLDPIAWFWVVWTIVFYIFGSSMLISAYKVEDVSNIAIISKISLGISFLLGIILFNEVFKITKGIGLLFIIVAVIVIFYERKNISSSKGMVYALAGGTFTAFATICERYALDYFTPYSLLLYPYLGIAITLGLIPGTAKTGLLILKRFKFKIILAQFINSLSYILFLIALLNLGISVGYITWDVVILITPVLLGVIFLKETQRLSYKIIGTILTTVGIYLLF